MCKKKSNKRRIDENRGYNKRISNKILNKNNHVKKKSKIKNN